MTSEQNRILHWMHNHPPIIKLFGDALVLLGAFALYKIKRLRKLDCCKLVLAILSLSSAILLKKNFNTVRPKALCHKKFTEFFTKSAQLVMINNFPVLILKTMNTQENGIIQGKFFARAIYSMKSKNILPTLSESADRVMEKFKKLIPENYLAEMQGIIEGYQTQKAKLNLSGRDLTLKELIFFHLRPEQKQFKELANLAPFETIHSSVTIDCPEKQGFVMESNVDWKSRGVMGSYSFLVARKCDEDTITLSLTVPGMVGNLNGINSSGLCLSVSECSADLEDIKGVPAVFYSRLCLEQCKRIKQITTFGEKPTGSFDLSVIDSKKAAIIHYQPKIHIDSEVKKYVNSPLKVNNHSETPISNINTIQSIVFNPAGPEIAIATENGWAADKSKQTFKVNEIAQKYLG